MQKFKTFYFVSKQFTCNGATFPTSDAQIVSIADCCKRFDAFGWIFVSVSTPKFYQAVVAACDNVRRIWCKAREKNGGFMTNQSPGTIQIQPLCNNHMNRTKKFWKYQMKRKNTVSLAFYWSNSVTKKMSKLLVSQSNGGDTVTDTIMQLSRYNEPKYNTRNFSLIWMLLCQVKFLVDSVIRFSIVLHLNMKLSRITILRK